MSFNVARIFSFFGTICLLLIGSGCGTDQSRALPQILSQQANTGELNTGAVPLDGGPVLAIGLAAAASLAAAAYAGARWGRYSTRQRSLARERQLEQRIDEIERRRQAAECMNEVILRLNQNRPLQDSLEYLACQAYLLLRAQWVGVFQSEGEGQTRLLASYQGGNPGTASGLIVPGALIGLLARRARAMRAPTLVLLNELEEGLAAKGAGLPRGAQRVIVHPILLDGAVCGGMAALLGNHSQQILEEQDLLAGFCAQAALAIGNDRRRVKAEELAVVAERNRLARDLHDAVTQTLFSASLIAETLPTVLKDDPKEGSELLLELRQLTRGALAEMRTLLMELRPAVMVDAKLTDLLRQLVDAVTGKKGIVVQFRAADIRTLPEDVHICLYRIAQEALANVVKHSRARSIAVTLSEQALDGAAPCRYVILEICDDGRGFDLERIPPDHFGLVNMRERAQAAGAQLQVITRPGAGTIVRAVWMEKDG